jgi:hypothetical protein
MRRSWLTALLLAAAMLPAASSLAGVNCNQVKKYLDTGRTPQDIADTMVIPVEEVKKCQEGSDTAGATAAPPASAAGGAASGAATTPPQK